MNTAESRPTVSCQNLSVSFGNFFAVKNVSFSVQPGEIFGFLGANGAGKTTTIRVLCGLLAPTSGQVQIDGVSYNAGARAIKSKVGYMSQKFTLYDDLSVEENLHFAASIRGLDLATLRKRRSQLLDFVGFSLPLNTMVRHLSGGLKQQVSLACALLHEPSIIFLDEPTAGVTPAARARFWSLIRKLQADKKTIFVTTHYMDEAEYCGRIALMRSGELIALDTVAGLKKSAFPEPIYELTPKNGPLSSAELHEFRGNALIHSLQPYGIRYHAVVKSQHLFKKVEHIFAARFLIRPTEPSLEDVFIELTQGRSKQ